MDGLPSNKLAVATSSLSWVLFPSTFSGDSGLLSSCNVCNVKCEAINATHLLMQQLITSGVRYLNFDMFSDISFDVAALYINSTTWVDFHHHVLSKFHGPMHLRQATWVLFATEFGYVWIDILCVLTQTTAQQWGFSSTCCVDMISWFNLILQSIVYCNQLFSLQYLLGY